jgi:hypothetical protein
MLKQETIGQIHIGARERLSNRHNELMKEIMEKNSDKEKYWILGMAMCKRKNGRTTIKPFLKAYYEQPEVRKESYLYEIDNVKGTQSLVWVMHPHNKLAIPSIGKKLSVAN